MSVGRSVFVTGGTGSVGRDVVAAFTQVGCRVVFQFATDDAAAEALSSKTGAHSVKMDFNQPVSLQGYEADILVNNAGINISDRPTALVEDKDWDATIAVNLTAPFRLVRSALPGMVARGWGRIINVSSTASVRAAENNLPYTVSKHALSALTRTVAKEYASSGITSNEICPGPIESDMMSELARRRTADGSVSAECWLQSVRRSIPAQRLAVPAEIAQLAVFLASDAASYINGASIVVDGGLSA